MPKCALKYTPRYLADNLPFDRMTGYNNIKVPAYLLTYLLIYLHKKIRGQIYRAAVTSILGDHAATRRSAPEIVRLT